MKKLWLMAAGALMMAACSSDENEEQAFVADKGEIQLLFIHPNQTRATETSFENADELGVYVTAADETLQIGGNEVNNEQFTYNGTSWTSKRKVYWNEGLHNVYAYYPYTKTINDVEDFAFELQTDQNTSDGFTKSDFLWAGKKDVAASATAVTNVDDPAALRSGTIWKAVCQKQIAKNSNTRGQRSHQTCTKRNRRNKSTALMA